MIYSPWPLDLTKSGRYYLSECLDLVVRVSGISWDTREIEIEEVPAFWRKMSMNHKWKPMNTAMMVECEVCNISYYARNGGIYPVDSPCIHPDSFLGRRGGMVPTVSLGPKAAEGITPERQALMDIEEYMKNFDGTRCAFSDIQEIIDEVLYE